jgi:DnaJ domain
MAESLTQPDTNLPTSWDSLAVIKADCLSEATLTHMKHYLETGANRAHREKTLFTLLSLVDWMPLSELPIDTLRGWTPQAKRRLLSDLKGFYTEKQNAREEQTEKNKEYRDRVDAHYRNTLTMADKQLLESLRDFELETCGRDVNWQHYFRFKSFKRIDAFAKASHAERLKMFQAFQVDVLAYKQNKELWRESGGNLWGPPPPMDFDTWCDNSGCDNSGCDNSGFDNTQGSSQAKPTHNNATISTTEALHTLGLTASFSESQLKQAFRQKTLKCHPDMPEGSETKMRSLLEAYDLLKQQTSH